LVTDATLLTFEGVELLPSVADSFETQAVDEIERARRPLIVLMLVVCPENELRYGARVAHSASPSIARLVAEAIEELPADETGDSWQPAQ
jgi:hypothetical protein